MKFNKARIIFLTGPPLAGKDTQGRLLAKKLKGRFIVTSDLIKTFLEKTKKNYLKIDDRLINLKQETEKFKTGGLVDSSLVIHLIIARLKEALDKKETLIISGSPRKIIEAQKEFYFLKNKADFVFIFLNINQKEIFQRAWKRKREDDAFRILQKRIELYKKDTLPTVNFLKKKGVLISINGKGPVISLHKKITKKLKYFSML